MNSSRPSAAHVRRVTTAALSGQSTKGRSTTASVPFSGGSIGPNGVVEGPPTTFYCYSCGKTFKEVETKALVEVTQ